METKIQLIVKPLFLIPIVLFFSNLYSQEETPELTGDRPDQTESAFVIPQRLLQIESGFVYEKESDDFFEIKNYTYNSTLFRYGLFDHFELRLVLEYSGIEQRNKATNIKTSLDGMQPITIGSKIFVHQEKGILPQIAFLGYLTLPYSGDKLFRPDFIAPSFVFACENTISSNLSLGYNFGASWDGINPNAEGFLSIVLGLSATNKLGCFAEFYGFFPEKQTTDLRFDGGLTYLLKDNLQLDLAGGVGLSEISPDGFFTVGFIWRVPE